MRANCLATARSGWASLALAALGLSLTACSEDGGGLVADPREATAAPAPSTAGAQAGNTSGATPGSTSPATTTPTTTPSAGDEAAPAIGSIANAPVVAEVGSGAVAPPAADAGSDAGAEPPVAVPEEAVPPEPTRYDPCPPSGTVCTIMPLGDSITDGFTVRGGYRIPFFQRAQRDNKQFTFVGSRVNGPASVDGVPFPQQNEGHSAHTMFDAPEAPIPRIGISNYIPDSIPRFQPDIVLLMIGTNDVDGNVDLPNATRRLGTLIDSIIALDSHSLIVVAQITPTMQDPLNQRIEAFNAGIPAIVEARAAAGKHVMLVDMYEAFVQDPAYKTKFLADRLHPNSAGYQVMSDVWSTAIYDLLH